MRFRDIERLASALPGITVGTSYGTPALRVGKRFMARLTDKDPDVLVLTPVEDDEQRFLMETQPDVFFKTPHYVGHPSILIRLSKVDPTQLSDLLEEAWRRLATKTMLAAQAAARPKISTTRRRGSTPADG